MNSKLNTKEVVVFRSPLIHKEEVVDAPTAPIVGADIGEEYIGEELRGLDVDGDFLCPDAGCDFCLCRSLCRSWN